MPTEPYKPLLNRDLNKALIKELNDIASPALQEAVNYATNLYQKCQGSTKGNTDEAFPVLALYLHIIQLTDAIEVLISNSCVEPAQLLLRSSFEAKLGMEYMTEKMRRTRAVAWMVKNIIDAIELRKELDPSHPKGRAYRQTFENADPDQIMNMPPPFPTISDDDINSLQASLEKPEYADVYQEYERMAKKRQRIEWYSLYNGPRNIRELAEYLKHGFEYRLYQNWSKMSHVADTRHLTLPLEDGTTVLGPIRNPLNMAHIACYALGMLLEASQLMIKEYRSSDFRSFGKWWGKELKDKHMVLARMSLNHLKWFDEKFTKGTC
ncbi:DUF5677 domain-containing protein [Chloroflexota bacterium]